MFHGHLIVLVVISIVRSIVSKHSQQTIPELPWLAQCVGPSVVSGALPKISPDTKASTCVHEDGGKLAIFQRNDVRLTVAIFMCL